MANILIYSNNPQLSAHWTHALISTNSVSRLSNINSNFNADAVLFDAKKLDDDNGLLSLFSNKSIRFLIVGTNWPEEKQIDAMMYGAAGYCEADEPPELIQRALESILKGDIWIRRALVPKVISAMTGLRQQQRSKPQTVDVMEMMKLFETLSIREIEVADLIQQGESNKRIAMELDISERTVKAHMSSIFRKLGVDDRLNLALLLKELEQYRKTVTS